MILKAWGSYTNYVLISGNNHVIVRQFICDSVKTNPLISVWILIFVPPISSQLKWTFLSNPFITHPIYNFQCNPPSDLVNLIHLCATRSAKNIQFLVTPTKNIKQFRPPQPSSSIPSLISNFTLSTLKNKNVFDQNKSTNNFFKPLND